MQNWNVYKFTSLPRPIYAFPLPIVLIIFFISGCTLPPERTHDDFIVIQANRNALWLRCQKELKDRGFRLDRVDPRAGIIETYPLISRQWFEFGRQDVADRQSLLESSLHNIRRQVHIELIPEGNDNFRLLCRVNVQRLSKPPTLFSGTVWAENIFSGADGRIHTWSETDSPQDKLQVWINLGNDPALEAQFYKSIQKWQKNTI